MAKQTINIGASPNDGTGTPLRTAFDYTNQNFTELYTALGGGVGLPGATTQVIFNDGGTNLAGDAGLVYNKTTDTLTAGNATITGDLTVDTSTLKVDSTNNRVGIGTASPANTLDVNGDITQRNGSGTIIGNIMNSAGLYDVKASANVNGLQLSTSTANPIVFAINNAEAMRLNASGNLAFPTGKGIDFSATANSSGTMTSELLNDYEEGTFTPTIVGSGTTGTGTYTTQTGRYTKIGNQVTVQIYFFWTAHTGTGDMFVTGLPFTLANVSGLYPGVAFGIIENITLSAGKYLIGYGNLNTTNLILLQYPTGGGPVAGVPIDTSGSFSCTMTYQAA